MRDLTADEQRVADLLGEAFNLHERLPEIHEADRPEFMTAIHAAQNIVLARPATEQQLSQR